MRRVRVAVVLKGYPRLSETFIAQELLGLKRRGLDLMIISLRHPTDAETHPIHDEIAADILYLPEYLYQEPLRVLRAWWSVARLPGYLKARRTWLRDFRRDLSPNRIRRFGQACVLANELPSEFTWLYAHFLHTPTSVARYAATILNIPWSASAHAKDIWTSPDWEMSEKLADAKWVVTCTSNNVRHLTALAPKEAKVELLYHGLDLSRFPDAERNQVANDGTEQDNPVVLLSVGRAVAKKGYDDLLTALSALPTSLSWRFVHIGGGPLTKQLKSQADKLQLSSRIEWLGPRAQTDVVAAYQRADIFVLASKVAADGDRDGLPNVLMEAQSQRLPCVSTNVSAIPELISSGQNGILVEPSDHRALADALLKLIADPSMRRRMGNAGRETMETHFTHDVGIDRLLEMFPAA